MKRPFRIQGPQSTPRDRVSLPVWNFRIQKDWGHRFTLWERVKILFGWNAYMVLDGFSQHNAGEITARLNVVIVRGFKVSPSQGQARAVESEPSTKDAKAP